MLMCVWIVVLIINFCLALSASNFYFGFCFAEELARFWSAFEDRISSDLNIYSTSANLYSNYLILSFSEVLSIKDLSSGPFRTYLLTHLVKTNINDGTKRPAKRFTEFLLNMDHYKILYQRWKDLG